MSASLLPVAEAMAPVFEVLAGVVDALTPLLRIGQTLIAGWVQLFTDMIAALLPGKEGVKGFVEQFAEAMRELSAAIMKVVATIAKFFGATSFIDGMVKSLTGKMSEKKDATGMGAPTGGAFTSATDFGKQVATRAFLATGEMEKNKTTEQWLATLSEDLKGIKEGTNTAIKDAIAAGVEPVAGPIREMLTAVRGIASTIAGGVYDVAASAKSSAFEFGNRITFGGLSAINAFMGDAK